MIEPLAQKLAVHIKSVVPDHPSSVAVLKHSIAISLNAVSIVLITLLLSWFTGKTKEAAILLVMFALLRQLTGGIHLKTGLGCIAVTSLSFTVLSFVTMDNWWTIGATLVSMVLILMYAPAGIERQSKIPPRFYPILKLIAFILVGTNVLILSPILAVCFLAQSLTLIRGRR